LSLSLHFRGHCRVNSFEFVIVERVSVGSPASLNNLGSKPTGFEFVDWKSTPVSVIPAHAGIHALFELAARMKGAGFHHPQKGHQGVFGTGPEKTAQVMAL